MTDQTIAGRPGLRTTEFWLALVVTTAGIAAAVFSKEPWAQIVGGVAATLTANGYAFARAGTKKALVPLVACSMLLALGSCSTPAAQYVQAERALHDRLAPEYLALIDAADQLPVVKGGQVVGWKPKEPTGGDVQQRHDLVQAWDWRIRQAEQALAGAPVPSGGPAR